VSNTFEGLDVVPATEGIAAGDAFFIYDPERNLNDKQRFPFATIVTKDYGDFDSASNLNRPGVFPMNIGVSRDTFRALSGQARGEHDYAALDVLPQHPVYARQAWVSVLNPSDATFETLKPLLAEAYAIVVRRRGG
jgi:hypothetical protein